MIQQKGRSKVDRPFYQGKSEMLRFNIRIERIQIFKVLSTVRFPCEFLR